MKKLFFLALTLVALHQSCKKESDSPSSSPIIISTNITTATTLDKVTPAGEPDYIVTVPIVISADVVVKPGVIIVFKNGADFTINTAGSLNATGTVTAPIVFKGEQDIRGFWGGLYFKSMNANNKLIYCTVGNAGGNDHTIPAKKGAVIVYGTGMLEIANSIILKSGGFGLLLTEASSMLDNSKNNSYKTCILGPVGLPVSSIFALDSTSDYSGNDLNYIDCSDDGVVSGTQTWQALNVPYLLPEAIIQITGNVKVEAGVHVKARQGAGIQVKETGSLKAIGTATSGIIFEGNQNVKGYWAGIQFNSMNSNNIFKYVTISDGGSATSGFIIPIRKANVEVNETGSLEITYSTIKNSNGYGIRVITGGSLTQNNNTFTSNTDGNVN
jgi:hypothetical protein